MMRRQFKSKRFDRANRHHLTSDRHSRRDKYSQHKLAVAVLQHHYESDSSVTLKPSLE